LLIPPTRLYESRSSPSSAVTLFSITPDRKVVSAEAPIPFAEFVWN
jgi:hypothetical protein